MNRLIRSKKWHVITRDLLYVAVSIVVAIFFTETGVVHDVLSRSRQGVILGSFIAGMFFTSVFTTVPAITVLGELALDWSPWYVALVGGLGAMVGDFVIFKFIRNRLVEDFKILVSHKQSKRLWKLFRLGIFRWFIPLLGALVIASPLPDELGLAMLGVSRIGSVAFTGISFSLNFLGILVIGYLSRAIL